MNIGVDIVEISRIKKSAENPRFLSRVFSPSELKFFSEKKFHPEVIAGNFCAKEALVKAFGIGFRGISFKEISVLRDYNGCPYFILTGKAKKLQIEQKLGMRVSISHCREYAEAMVITYEK